MCHINITYHVMKRKIPWNLIIARLKGDITEKENTQLNVWLAKEQNLQLFEELETLWEKVQLKTAIYEADMEYYWKKLSTYMEKEEKVRNFMPPENEKNKIFSITHFTRKLAAACVLLILALSGTFFLGQFSTTKKIQTQTIVSMNGKSKVVLSDGTEVWLHSNTTLTFHEKKNLREAELNGEAFFNVTHNKKVPFLVKSNDVKVKVYGTKFNVNSYATSDNTIVSLYEGSVSLSAGDKTIMLKPGQEGNYNKEAKNLKIDYGDIEYAKSWTNDQLHFENKSIREICKYLSKWYSAEIIIDNRIPNDQSFTFTLQNEPLEEVIRIMARINSFDYQFLENNRLLIQPLTTNLKNNKPMQKVK